MYLVTEHIEPTVLIYRKLLKGVQWPMGSAINNSPFPISKKNTCIFLNE